MKYTLQTPDLAFEAFVLNDEGNSTQKVVIGKLLHLPNATAQTAAMFRDYTHVAWETQPQFAAFDSNIGSPVLAWNGQLLDISSQQDLEKHQMGVFSMNRVVGEIGTMSRVLVIDLREKAQNEK
jgi:hypothetical protein